MGKENIKCGVAYRSNAVLRSDQKARKMTFVASDGTRDSAGTVLNQSGWDLTRFNKNGVIGYQHKVYGADSDTANPDNIIGKGRAYIETDGRGRKRLLVDVTFEPEGLNPLADKIYKKLQFGTLKAVSVGFRALGVGHYGKGSEAAGGANETYYYAGQELLEVSVVNIPANPNALKRLLPVPAGRRDADADSAEKAKALSLAGAALALADRKTSPRTDAEIKKALGIIRAEDALSEGPK